MDVVTYALARKYVEDTAIALGAVKGTPCRIQSIVEDDDKSTITFAWTGTDGTNKTSVLTVKNGLKISAVDFNDANELVCTMSDGTELKTTPLKVGGVLTEDLVANVAIGDVTVGKKYTKGTNIETVLRDILITYQNPAIILNLNPDTTLYNVVTDFVNTIDLIATTEKKTNDILKVDFYVDNVLKETITTGVASGGTVTYNYAPATPINTDTSFKAVVTDIKGKSTTSTVKQIKFVGMSYYGILPKSTVSPTIDEITNMNTILKDTKKFVYSGITTPLGKVCIAYPSIFGELTSIKDLVHNIDYSGDTFVKSTITINNLEYYCYIQKNAVGVTNGELTFA